MIDLHQSFIQLIRLGIGTSNEVSIPEIIDWNAIMALATKQGLSAVVLDGIERLPESLKPPKVLLLRWIGEVLQSYEYRYELYRRAIAEMAGFYNEHHFKMMVLKGYACSLDWPKSEHRPCGDIDIWLFGKQRIADDVLSKEVGVVIDTSHHHHTKFNWRDFSVENHYDFLDVHHHKSNAKLEKILKDLGRDDSNSVELYGEKVYLPSANLHALFLLKHAMNHFAATELNLRQLLDWAFFVEKHGKDVDWHWLLGVLEQYGMLPLSYLFNAICVEDVGVEAELLTKFEVDSQLKERVLNEILSPEIPNTKPKNFIIRVLWKFRRWKANEWKHKLCYKESMWSAFWSGVWGHLLKPKSI